MSGLTESILQAGRAPYLVLSTDRTGRSSLVHFLHTLAQLATYGRSFDLEPLFAGRVSTQDCLNLKQVSESNPKKG